MLQDALRCEWVGHRFGLSVFLQPFEWITWASHSFANEKQN